MTDDQFKNACDEILRVCLEMRLEVDAAAVASIDCTMEAINEVRNQPTTSERKRVVFERAHNLLEALIKPTASVRWTNVLYGLRCLIEETQGGGQCDSYQP